MIVKEPTVKEKLEGYERTRAYIKNRLREASVQFEGIAQMWRSAAPDVRRAMIGDAKIADKKVRHWRFLLTMLEPPPTVLTGIFPGPGRDAVDRARKAGKE